MSCFVPEQLLICRRLSLDIQWQLYLKALHLKVSRIYQYGLFGFKFFELLKELNS